VAAEAIHEGFVREEEKRPRKVKYVKDEGPDWVCHAPIADPHIGKYVWGKEGWGEDYDTHIACQRIRETADDVAAWILRQPGHCRKIYATNIGDFWHAIDGQTQSGTQLHQDTRAKKVIEEGSAAEKYRIDRLREVCDEVEIEFTEGNHDHIFLHLTYREVDAWYRNVPGVTVNVRNDQKVWFKEGKCMHFFDHGKGINSLSSPSAHEKSRTAVSMVASVEDRAFVEHYYYYIGHLHHREVSEAAEMELIRLPAIAEGDDYEEELRVASRVGSVAYRLDEDGYIEDQHNVRFKSGS
jgi:hypothetical protein